MPWIVMTAVDVADPGSAKPFVENLARYGLLPDPGRDDGLPVGLTVASNPFTFGMDFVGVNCAACHVGELHHGGKAVRVDGAPNMFNLQLFYSDAIDAVMAATSNRGKLWHALKRLGRQDYARYGIAGSTRGSNWWTSSRSPKSSGIPSTRPRDSAVWMRSTARATSFSHACAKRTTAEVSRSTRRIWSSSTRR
jgi:hypothetical protein